MAANSATAAPANSRTAAPAEPVLSEIAARRNTNRRAINRVVWTSLILWFVVPFVAVFAALVVVNWIVALVLALVVGAAVGIGRTLTVRAAVATGLRQVFGGDAASADEHSRFVNLVDGLCIGSGIEAPELLVIDDPGANLATFGPAGDAVMVATTGLLSALGRVELEGVIAEGLARIDQGDAELAGVVATFALGPVLRSGPTRTDRSPGRVSTRAEKIAAGAFVDHRHFLADLDAVMVTRYPPGLRQAMVKMAAAGTAVASATWGSSQCWMCDPLAEIDGDDASRLAHAVGHHPSMTLRIDLLSEL